MKMKKEIKRLGRGILVTAVALVFGICLGSPAVAGEYPDKPIKLIVPWGAGGDTDAIMRVIAHFAGQELGQTMVVVNVPGVGGTLGARQGKDAKPDGYTLTATHESVISSKIVGVVEFGYEAFTPLANLALTPGMVAARADAPWNDMKDLVADAKKRPGQISFGATLGSTSHFFPLEIAHKAGIELNIVGYEGTAKRQAALLGGFIDLGESNPAAGKKYFEAKRLKALGIATEERHELLPDIPTLKEQGFDVLLGVNRGVCAPLDTPAPIVKKLSDAFAKVAQDPEFIKKMAELGTDVKYRDAESYKAYNKAETERLTKLAEIFNIKAAKK
jgi:tripartite-type tricarboxylate transporter receptor subunit TctC